MSILLGLTPFILFFVLMRLSTPFVALAAATVLSAVLMGRGMLRGVSPKILELGSVILFGVLTLYTLVVHADWSVAGVRLAVDGGLALIVLISLAIRRPFTIQYAKESVPKELWNSPIFIHTNDLITGVWAINFIISAACDAVAIWLPSVPVTLLIAVTVAAFVVAIWFSVWYPGHVRRSIPRPAGAAS